jgi:hypothetical protein
MSTDFLSKLAAKAAIGTAVETIAIAGAATIDTVQHATGAGPAIPKRPVDAPETAAAEAILAEQLRAKTEIIEEDYFSHKHENPVGLRYFHSTHGGSAMIPMPDGQPMPFEFGIFSTSNANEIVTCVNTIPHCRGAVREVTRDEALRIVAANMKLTKPFQTFARGAVSSGAAKGMKQGNYVEVVAQARGTEISEFTRTGMAALLDQAETGVAPQK